MYNFAGRLSQELCRPAGVRALFGMRWGSTRPPGGDQVDGRPPVLNKLPAANGAPRDKQEIDDLRCLRGSVLKFYAIKNIIWKWKLV